jgi:BarA-like signal transduction histidine kinase
MVPQRHAARARRLLARDLVRGAAPAKSSDDTDALVRRATIACVYAPLFAPAQLYSAWLLLAVVPCRGQISARSRRLARLVLMADFAMLALTAALILWILH